MDALNRLAVAMAAVAAVAGCQCIDPTSLEFTACTVASDCAGGLTCCPDQKCRADCKHLDAGTCGSIVCALGTVCVAQVCVPQGCGLVKCADGAVCVNDVCTQLTCVGVSCPAGERCADGVCYSTSCGTTPCDGGLCVGNQCLDRSCTGLTCPTGSRCVQGSCAACAATEVNCADGVDDDCNQLTDCDDPACDGRACDDHNECTTAETCGERTCRGGTMTGCNNPGICRSAPGTCDAVTGSCSYPAASDGTTCSSADPCLVSTVCSQGTCSGPLKSCSTPPNGCQLPSGSCQSDGGCTYPPKPMGTVCDDGNPCTPTDTCNATGQCVGTGMKVCPAPAQCKSAGACDPSTGACTYGNAPAGTACDDGNPCSGPDSCNGAGTCTGPGAGDGTQCGPAYSQRCCGGACVDISNDTRHCGGCNTPCAPNRGCQSVAQTTNCSSNPANYSGRCVCAGATGECPRSQICRAGQAQYNNLCTPPADSDCQGGARSPSLSGCPEYCKYP